MGHPFTLGYLLGFLHFKVRLFGWNSPSTPRLLRNGRLARAQIRRPVFRVRGLDADLPCPEADVRATGRVSESRGLGRESFSPHPGTPRSIGPLGPFWVFCLVCFGGISLCGVVTFFF